MFLFCSASYANEQKVHLLLCASGSVAIIKIPLISKALIHEVVLAQQDLSQSYISSCVNRQM